VIDKKRTFRRKEIAAIFSTMSAQLLACVEKCCHRVVLIEFSKSLQAANIMATHRIYAMSFASVYPLYVAKAAKKGRTQAEVDEIIRWLTGYGQKELEGQLKKQTDFETFFAKAPRLNPSRALIKGVVCGVRVEDIKEPLMQEIRYLDKLIDELAKGKALEKILRKQ